MLLKRNITQILANTPEWEKMRLAKFTSSENYHLVGENLYDKGFISYVYRKVGELMSGESAREDVSTAATAWGNENESGAINKFMQVMGLKFITCQALIHAVNTMFSSTPDAIWNIAESLDESSYDVATLEAKCPKSFDAYLRLFSCDTPMDLKKEKKEYYWQVLDQMDNCDTTRGYFIAYQPKFRFGDHKIIEFKAGWEDHRAKKPEDRFPLRRDLWLLRERKKLAVEMFEKIRNKLMNAA